MTNTMSITNKEGQFGWKLIGAFTSVALAIAASWVQMNSRISALEVQVKMDRDAYQQTSQQMNELINRVTDIQMKVTELSTKLAERDGRYKNINQ